jgi:hypothetical protein
VRARRVGHEPLHRVEPRGVDGGDVRHGVAQVRGERGEPRLVARGDDEARAVGGELSAERRADAAGGTEHDVERWGGGGGRGHATRNASPGGRFPHAGGTAARQLKARRGAADTL